VRKLHFAMRANALVVFPGGFGTLLEHFPVALNQGDSQVLSVRRGWIH
jgi:predicted Rossmann-fold nucleotide-binding protein